MQRNRVFTLSAYGNRNTTRRDRFPSRALLAARQQHSDTPSPNLKAVAFHSKSCRQGLLCPTEKRLTAAIRPPKASSVRLAVIQRDDMPRFREKQPSFKQNPGAAEGDGE